VTAGRLQLLADGQHGDAVCRQVVDYLQDLGIDPAEPNYDPGLGRYAGMSLFEILQRFSEFWTSVPGRTFYYNIRQCWGRMLPNRQSPARCRVRCL
jgi:hypothetical protein